MNSLSPKVTVYVTNHNYGRYIDQCVQSIYDQTFRDFELILIDDGSTDGSDELIRKYEGFNQTRVVIKQGEGLNKTNNLALRLARGQYIIRVDADDFLRPEMLDELVKAIESEQDVLLVFPDYYLVDESGKTYAEEKRHDFESVTLHDQPAHGACTLVLTSLLRELNGYSEDFKCQDGYELWIRSIERGKVKNVNKPLFYYRQHEKSLSKNRAKILETRANIIRRYSTEHLPVNAKHLAVMPIRSGIPSRIALQEIGVNRLVDYVISEVQKSELIDTLVVTTDDQTLLDHLEARYRDEIDICIMHRPAKLSMLNSRIEDTLRELIENSFSEYTTVTQVSVEHVLRKSFYIDKSIRLLYIFKADCCIAVEQVSDNIYRHEGNGMLPIVANRSLRSEREYLYREIGGLRTATCQHIFEGYALTEGRITHVNMDELSCMDASSPYMLGFIVDNLVSAGYGVISQE